MFSKPVDSYSLLRSLELILRMPSPSGIGLVVVTAVIFYLRFCKSAGLFLKVPVMLDHVFLCHVIFIPRISYVGPKSFIVEQIVVVDWLQGH